MQFVGGRLLVALLLSTQACAEKREPGIFKRLEAAGEDALEEAAFDFKTCSCTCCMATERADQELERSADGQSLLTHKCVHPSPSTEECPMECIARDRRHTLEEEQYVNPGSALDYARYCYHNCVPAVLINGGQCANPNSANLTAGGFDLPKPPKWSPGDLKKPANQTASEAKSVEAAADEAAKEELKKVSWDLRSIVVERTRAEAGAAAARAAYAAERAKLHSQEMKRSTKMLDRIKTAVVEQSKTYEPDFELSKANASAAAAAVAESYNALKKAKASLRKVGEETRQLAKTMIQGAAAQSAKMEAESYSQRMHFEDTAAYRRQVVNTAAFPYVSAVTTGLQRVAEYEQAATAAEELAREAKVKMDRVQQEAERIAAQGDRIAAGMKRREATTLRHQAEDAEAQAAKYRATAVEARDSARQWQEAAEKVAAQVAFQYDQSVATTPSPPPIVALPQPPVDIR
ncbi:SLC8A1 [Symbiodinium necroappetens]|uniref:SLC8A1 protein n=1 Tax=Symbiodinium necroappetens TaxID=1628268 RepID=A0A812RPC3_9DINO|nr:SLC8A1 [Symbiodinium necroappetens]